MNLRSPARKLDKDEAGRFLHCTSVLLAAPSIDATDGRLVPIPITGIEPIFEGRSSFVDLSTQIQPCQLLSESALTVVGKCCAFASKQHPVSVIACSAEVWKPNTVWWCHIACRS